MYFCNKLINFLIKIPPRASINEEKEKAEYVDQLQSKVNDLVYKVDGLQRDLELRQWTVERKFITLYCCLYLPFACVSLIHQINQHPQ